MDGARGVLLSIYGGSDLGLFEINEAATLVSDSAHPDANIIFGAVIDDTLGDEVKVTVIAAGFDSGQLPYKKVEVRRPEASTDTDPGVDPIRPRGRTPGRHHPAAGAAAGPLGRSVLELAAAHRVVASGRGDGRGPGRAGLPQDVTDASPAGRRPAGSGMTDPSSNADRAAVLGDNLARVRQRIEQRLRRRRARPEQSHSSASPRLIP